MPSSNINCTFLILAPCLMPIFTIPFKSTLSSYLTTIFTIYPINPPPPPPTLNYNLHCTLLTLSPFYTAPYLPSPHSQLQSILHLTHPLPHSILHLTPSPFHTASYLPPPHSMLHLTYPLPILYYTLLTPSHSIHLTYPLPILYCTLPTPSPFYTAPYSPSHHSILHLTYLLPILYYTLLTPSPVYIAPYLPPPHSIHLTYPLPILYYTLLIPSCILYCTLLILFQCLTTICTCL